MGGEELCRIKNEDHKEVRSRSSEPEDFHEDKKEKYLKKQLRLLKKDLFVKCVGLTPIDLTPIDFHQEETY